MIQNFTNFECDRCHSDFFHITDDWKRVHVHEITVREHILASLSPITTSWQICDYCLRELNDFLYKTKHVKEEKDESFKL